MKRVLLTGATGYLGSHLARALLPEAEVFALARMPLNTDYVADIQDRVVWLPYDGSCGSMAAAMEAARPELVYHLAAYYTGGHGLEDTPKLVESNLALGAYLLEAMADAGCPRLVYAATVMEHFQGAAYRPLNLYAATKRAFSDLLAYYADAGLLRAVGLTLSDTYGPGDRRPKILNRIRKAAEAGEPLALSDGGQDYDLVYADDVIRAFLLAGEGLERENWKNERFQVCAAQPLTLRETVEMMLRVNGVSWQGDWGERPAAPREMRKAARVYPVVPGWEETIPLEEGLRRVWRMNS